MTEPLLDGAVQVVQAVGLPTLFCLWLMLRVEKKLDEQTGVQREIANAMAAVLEHVRKEE